MQLGYNKSQTLHVCTLGKVFSGVSYKGVLLWREGENWIGKHGGVGWAVRRGKENSNILSEKLEHTLPSLSLGPAVYGNHAKPSLF